MDNAINNCRLFSGLSQKEIDVFFKNHDVKIKEYDRSGIIFHQGDKAESFFVLLCGKVSVRQSFLSGNQTLNAVFSQSGELFGEVYAFLENTTYDYYAVAEQPCHVMEIHKSFFAQYSRCESRLHNTLIKNMLSILSEKAYSLNQRLLLLSCPTLRQKIAFFLLKNSGGTASPRINMSRDEMANYLGVARPSLSRELLNMQRQELITLNGRQISILNAQALNDLL
ncbi:MAG: Crp/Fnr family transcriptional regulator [Christensenellales bacterium]